VQDSGKVTRAAFLGLLHIEELKLHEILYIEEKTLFFSKQGFEEKSITKNVFIEIFMLRLYLASSCAC